MGAYHDVNVYNSGPPPTPYKSDIYSYNLLNISTFGRSKPIHGRATHERGDCGGDGQGDGEVELGEDRVLHEEGDEPENDEGGHLRRGKQAANIRRTMWKWRAGNNRGLWGHDAE